MRAQVRVIDQQSDEVKPADIQEWEKEQLLRKYGYTQDQPTQPTHQTKRDPKGDMSYEELCRMEDQRYERERQERIRKMNAPRPTTFGGNYDSNVSYSQDESGFAFKVDIVSDMKIPK